MCKRLLLQRKFRPWWGFYEPDKVLDVFLLLLLFAKLLQPRRACRNEKGLVLFADNFTATQTLFQGTKLSNCQHSYQ